MATVFLVFFSLLPFSIWYLYCLFHKHVTYIHLFAFPLVGALAVVFSVIIRLLLEPLGGLLPIIPNSMFIALVLTAVPEEVTKLLAVAPFVRNASCCISLPRKTLYARAVCIALAFASLENIVFAMRMPGSLTLRFLTAVPLHAATGLLSVLWLAKRFARNNPESQTAYSSINERFALSCAILLHAVYALGFELQPPVIAVSAFAGLMAVIRALFIWHSVGDNHDSQRS